MKRRKESAGLDIPGAPAAAKPIIDRLRYMKGKGAPAPLLLVHLAAHAVKADAETQAAFASILHHSKAPDFAKAVELVEKQRIPEAHQIAAYLRREMPVTRKARSKAPRAKRQRKRSRGDTRQKG